MDLKDYRTMLDNIDQNLLALFTQRMEIAAQIAAYKQLHNLPVLDRKREKQKIETITDRLPSSLVPYGQTLFEVLFQVSRAYQQSLIPESAPTGEDG